MIQSVEEYRYENNLPIAQLVIDFFQDDIIIIGEGMRAHQWFEIPDKKALLELSYQTHEFGFFQFGQGYITQLTDNGEFLRYVIGKIQEAVPVVFTTFVSWTSFHQGLVYEYAHQGEKQEGNLEYHQSFEKGQLPYPFQAMDLIGIKSLVYHILKEFHDKNITYTILKTLPSTVEE